MSDDPGPAPAVEPRKRLEPRKRDEPRRPDGPLEKNKPRGEDKPRRDGKPRPYREPVRPAGTPAASNRAIFGVLFVVALAVLAVWLVNRATYYASLGDCAFTHAPACRDLLGK